MKKFLAYYISVYEYLIHWNILSSYLDDELIFFLNCVFLNFVNIFSLLIIKPMAKPETKAPAVSAPIKKADFGLQLINFITNDRNSKFN